MGDQRNGWAPPALSRSARLIDSLGHPLSSAAEWVLRSSASAESQVYWRRGQRHAEREASLATNALTVFVDEGDRRGSAVAYLGDGGPKDERRIADAELAAGLVLNPGYRLPTGLATYPSVDLGDEPPDAKTLQAFGEKVQADLGRLGVTASHLELFSRRDEEVLMASNGRQHTWAGVALETDLVVAGGPDGAFEQRLFRRSRRLLDLLPEPALERMAEAVKDRSAAVRPPSGRLPVVLPAEELATLLDALRFRVSAEAVYNKIFPQGIGERLVEAKGDLLTLGADPLRPLAYSSGPTDESTVPGQRVSLIEDGVIKGLIADPQYAAYLGIEPTGPVGTLEWSPGSVSGESLLTGGRVLEVRGFSASMPNALTGDFAAEIKFGYLHEGGRRRPIAQGSVSGNLVELLADCRLSSETEEHPGYFGPAMVRFENVQVAGD